MKADNQIIMQALKAANTGHHQQAANLYRQAGNQIRNPSEKRELWDAADRHHRIHNSD